MNTYFVKKKKVCIRKWKNSRYKGSYNSIISIEDTENGVGLPSVMIRVMVKSQIDTIQKLYPDRKVVGS